MKKTQINLKDDIYSCKYSNSNSEMIPRNISEKKSEEQIIKEKYDKFLKPLVWEYSKVTIPSQLCLSDEIYYDQLKCIFCKNIAIESKMCIQCDNLYCNFCIKNITNELNNKFKCLSCDKNLRFKQLNKVLFGMFQNLILSCPSNFDYFNNCMILEKKCRDIVIFRDLIEHLNICKHIEKYVQCVNCNYSGLYSQVYTHLIQRQCNEYLKLNSIEKNNDSKQEEPKFESNNFDRLNEESSKKLKIGKKHNSIELNSKELVYNESLDCLRSRVDNNENNLVLIRDEIRSNFKNRIFKKLENFTNLIETIDEKDELINSLTIKINELQNKFEKLNDQVIQNNHECKENKELILLKINENHKCCNTRIDELSDKFIKNHENILNDIEKIRKYEIEKEEEMYNCSEIRNLMKLKNIQNYSTYTSFNLNVCTKDNSSISIKKLVNNEISSNLNNNSNKSLKIKSSSLSNSNPILSKKLEEKNSISTKSKFVGHTGNISYIIQIKSKNYHKEIQKSKYKIATASWDSTIKIWDFDNNKCIGNITGHVGAVYCIRQLRDFKKEQKIKCKIHKYYLKKLVSCGFDHTIRIWDLKTLKCLKIFQGHKNIIECVIQINNKIFSASHDKEIKIWNLSAKNILEDIKKKNKDSSENETSDEDDIFYSKKSKEVMNNLKIDLDYYENINNQSEEAKKFIREYSNRYFSGNLNGHTDIIKCLQKIKIDDKYFILSGAHDRTIRFWNIKYNYCEKILNGHEHFVNTILKIKWKYDEFSIASGSLDKTIRFWNLKTFECFFTIKSAHDDCINKLLFLKWKNKENIILSASDDKNVKLWSIEYDNKKQNNFEAKCIKILRNDGNAEYVYSIKQMKWGRDDTTILTGGKDNEVTIWS